MAWAGGLFEGEGSLGIVSGQRQPRLQLVTTDEDVARRFLAAVGCGNLRFYEREAYKDFWQWSVQSRDDVIAVIDMLWPYLGHRRKMRAVEVRSRALQIVRAEERTKCKRGHPLSGANLYVHRGKRGCRTCRNGWAVVPSG